MVLSGLSGGAFITAVTVGRYIIYRILAQWCRQKSKGRSARAQADIAK